MITEIVHLKGKLYEKPMWKWYYNYEPWTVFIEMLEHAFNTSDDEWKLNLF